MWNVKVKITQTVPEQHIRIARN